MIVRAFGSQERAFLLRGAQWRDLEKARDLGLGEIARRLAPLVTLKAKGLASADLMQAIGAGYLGQARLDDVREPLLQGLIGGGMSSTDAFVLVKAVFDGDVELGKGPMFEWADLAFSIVTGAMIGLEDEAEDAPGEPKAAAKPARRSRTAKPVSQPSIQP